MVSQAQRSDSAAWARIVVVRGDENPRRLVFDQGSPAHLSVGSDPAAGLRFSDPSVAPRQCDVVWDGTNLWLEDALRLGRTLVSGKRLNEWVPILGQVVVAFGPIRLWVAAEGPTPTSQVPDYAALERARLTQVLRDPDSRRCNTGRITLPPELLEPDPERKRPA